MGIASGISAGLGVGASIYQAINGAKERREASDALANYKRQELTNVADGLQASTLGSDIQKEEQSRLASSQVDALRSAGSRGILGGLQRVETNNQNVIRQTSADLDMQQKQIDQMRAEDQARIRGIQENREIGDINALSSQVQSGKNDMYQGIGNGIQSIGMLGGTFGKQAPTDLQPQIQGGVNQIQPQGYASYNNPIQATPYPTSQFGQFGQGMFTQPNRYTTQRY